MDLQFKVMLYTFAKLDRTHPVQAPSKEYVAVVKWQVGRSVALLR